MQKIGKKIKMLRKNKGMTQEQLAEVLSVSAQSVSKWENELSAPDIELLPIIARYFGITMDELFNYRLDALNYRERFIRFMADNGVLRFGEFRLRSGRISPYLIDTARYQSAAQISKLGEFYGECIRENGLNVNLLMGNTTGEIPLLIATGMNLYNKYGVDINYSINSILGKTPEITDEMILIKDTLTSGNSLRETLERMKEEGKVKLPDVIVSVNRMEQGNLSSLSAAREIEREFGVKICSIVTSEDIINALKKGVIAGAEYLDAMLEYQEKYAGK